MAVGILITLVAGALAVHSVVLVRVDSGLPCSIHPAASTAEATAAVETTGGGGNGGGGNGGH